LCRRLIPAGFLSLVVVCVAPDCCVLDDVAVSVPVVVYGVWNGDKTGLKRMMVVVSDQHLNTAISF
jgi:hypothetical protein